MESMSDEVVCVWPAAGKGRRAMERKQGRRAGQASRAGEQGRRAGQGRRAAEKAVQELSSQQASIELIFRAKTEIVQ